MQRQQQQQQQQQQPRPQHNSNKKDDQEIDQVWKQVRELQNNTAHAAREYQDIRANQKQLRGPTETAAERYQHRQVQQDFDRMKNVTQRINRDTEKIITKESQEVISSLEMGIHHLATEKQRLEARLAELNGQVDGMESEFEKELQNLEQQRKEMKRVEL